jgi:hypothetical protein
MDAGRDAVFARARQTLSGPLRDELKTYPVGWLLTQPLGNAAVLAARVYRTRLELFDRVLAAKGGNVRNAIQAITSVVRADHTRHPYEAVEKLVRG